MDDIEDRILDAWERIKPRLMEDAAELKRRPGRRNGRSLSRPPRTPAGQDRKKVSDEL